MNVVVDQLLTNYQLSGKGKLVLLLHGWGDSVAGLAGLQKELAKKYKVLAPNLPGFGGTQAPNEAWDLDGYAQFLEDLLKKLDLKQPYAVIGHSNGGALAIHSVAKSKLEPEKMVLIAASGIRTNNASQRLILKTLAKTGNIATLWMPERYRSALRRSLYETAGSDVLTVPHMQETFKKVVRQDVQADAASLELPTLLIYATNDKAVPLADGRKYSHLIKGSKLEAVEDAGHFVHQDQPEKVVKLIEGFLA